ncbi:hypothetical protein V2W45_1233133, partial [Cenococcum geophilum]
SFAEKAESKEVKIKDKYWIVLNIQPREYFHVSCLKKMLNLPLLAPIRFRLNIDYYQWN